MKKLTSAETLVLINHYANLLEAEGIRTEVRNQHLGSVMGEIPFFETWPQLWVVNDLDYDRAKQLIESADAEAPTEPWNCSKCGEQNEWQFSACWKCGTSAE